MSEPKTTCRACNVEILQSTADQRGGLCAPCDKGTRKQAKPKQPPFVSCVVDSSLPENPQFRLNPEDLLSELESTRHIGNSSHPNKFELEAQKALLRHAIRHRLDWKINDDHWGRTGYAILRLFELGRATMLYGGAEYQFRDIVKEEWRNVSGPLCGEGGFLYRTKDGTEIFRIMTWVS